MSRRAGVLGATIAAAIFGGSVGVDLSRRAVAEDAPPAMGRYVFGLLRRGPSWTPGRSARNDSLQRGHMANIGRMAEEGYLIGAGPFRSGGDLRGVFIFRDDSLHLLRAQAERDPAIQAGRLVMDLRTWHAPAGIGEPYRRLATRPGHTDSMVTLWLGLLARGPRHGALGKDSTEALQKGHVAYVLQRLSTGEYATAGPFEGDEDPIGVVVVRGDSVTARRVVDHDPAVRAGRLEARLLPWFVAYGVMPGDTLRK